MPRVEKYPARINLRLTPDTYDAFKLAADALGVEMTGLMRQCLDGAVPSMQMLAQSVESMKVGEVVAGTSLFAAFMDSLVAQGEAGRQQMHALKRQVEIQIQGQEQSA